MITGMPLSGGVAMAHPCFYRMRCAGAALGDTAQSRQTERVHRALLEVDRYFQKLARRADHSLSRTAGDIFRVQSMLVNDPSLVTALQARLSCGALSAEEAVSDTLDRFASELRAALSTDIAERASDIAELKYTLLMCLGNRDDDVHCRYDDYCVYGRCCKAQEHILIATQLLPGMVLTASDYTRGFVVETGCPSSHAAVLARMTGLPAVSGISKPDVTIPADCQVLVDGDRGRVYIDPSKKTLATYKDSLLRASRCTDIEGATAPVKGFRVLADLDRVDDMVKAVAARAEGIGLYRSENEVLSKQRILSEEEQFGSYSWLLSVIEGPVYIRLLDLGADKSGDWLGLPVEGNPALGCRGARLLLQRPELVRTQARALARASRKRRIHVLYPMVCSVEQYLKLHEVFATAIREIPDTNLLHGPMLEVPGACLQASEFLECADFCRIGISDLTQYLFAADRMSCDFERDNLFKHPVLWQLVGNIARAGEHAGKPVSLCGGPVGNPEYVSRILAAGISEVSACPRYIAELRHTARRCLEKSEG